MVLCQRHCFKHYIGDFVSLHSPGGPCTALPGTLGSSSARIYLSMDIRSRSLRCNSKNLPAVGRGSAFRSIQPSTSSSRPRCSAQQRHCKVQAAAADAEVAAPTISIRFVPQSGQSDVEVSAPSGEELLRGVMLENKVDLYTTWGKLVTCGGAGQCGTCIVQVVEGAELLSEQNDTERKKLNKKPKSWRLACQTVVGDGANSGQVVIRTKPQAQS